MFSDPGALAKSLIQHRRLDVVEQGEDWRWDIACYTHDLSQVLSVNGDGTS